MTATRPALVPRSQPRARSRLRVVRRASDPFPVRLRSPHLLVMNGDLRRLEEMGRTLSGHGYAITLASTLLDAGTVAALAPDLIVVDPFMPVSGTGHENVRVQPRPPDLHRDIPVICCTTQAMMARSMAEGGIPTVLMPYQAAHLLATIDALLDRGDARVPAGPVRIARADSQIGRDL